MRLFYIPEIGDTVRLKDSSQVFHVESIDRSSGEVKGVFYLAGRLKLDYVALFEDVELVER